MPDNVVKILDSTVSDTGPDQEMEYSFLDKDIPLRFSVSLGSGDTVVIEGKLESGDDYEVMHTFTDDTPADIYVMRLFRARRTVDGGSGDSWVKAQNVFNEVVSAHL